MRVLLASFVLLGACANIVDTDGLGDLSDYRSWDSFTVTGEIPGHGDTLRVIYANEVAHSWSGAGEYPIGSIIIKEIYPASDPNTIDYIAIMRKLDEPPAGGELQAGWLYTMLDESIESEEDNNRRCYRSCHVAAPYDSLFHDFGD